MNKLITHRNASTLGWTGLGLSLLSIPVTGWPGIVLATAGLVLCVASLIARFYLTGYLKGYEEGLTFATTEMRQAFGPTGNFTGPAFQAKTFREGADK